MTPHKKLIPRLAFLVCVLAAGVAPALELSAEAEKTLASIRTIAANFHSLDYAVDYDLDDLMAKGAEDEEALNAYISEKVLGGLPFNYKTIRLACSTFFSVTPDGDHVLARNMDLSNGQNFLVRTKPKNGYASLSMTTGHLIGYMDRFPDSMLGRLFLLSAPYLPLDGINEKGLSAAILMVMDKPTRQNTGKIPFTTTLAVRYMLDKAATVDEAIALMRRFDMRSIANTNLHFHITDAQGNSAVVEYVFDEMRVIRPTGYGHPVTNYYLTPWMKYVVIDGQDRMEILEAALNETKGVVDTAKAWQMLDSVKAVHDYGYGLDFMTDYSILYNNNKLTMDICLDADFSKVHSFSLKE